MNWDGMSIWLIIIVFVLGILAAFPLAIGICSVLGAIVLAVERLTTRCPACGSRSMKHVNSIRETYPTGKGTGRFYSCQSCHRNWFWSRDEEDWREASAEEIDRWFFPGKQRAPNGLV